LKKNLFLLLFLLFLEGCDSIFGPNNSISASGFVEKLEASTWMYGTYTLDDSNGKLLYALKSQDYNLDNFNNKKVNLSGNRVEGYPIDGGPILIDVKKIELIR